MKIAVIGAGAIGGLVAGYLKLKGEDVSLIGRPDSVEAIKKDGLRISGARGDFRILIDVTVQLNYRPALVILTTKTQDIEKAIQDNLTLIQDSLLLTTQNGVQADSVVSRYLSKAKIISSIVMFGATSLEPGKVVHNFEGSWIIAKLFGSNDFTVLEISEVLNKIFPTIIAQDLQGMKYLKIFVNANNCIPAILGLSMQEAFAEPEISRISIAIWKEGLEIVRKAGIELISLPDFPLQRLTKLVSLPNQEAVKIYSGIMASLSKEPLYGSILQSIKRGRASEIDYINGEFVNLAKENKIKAPLNEKMVEMVHRVEQTNKFFTKEQLVSEVKDLVMTNDKI